MPHVGTIPSRPEDVGVGPSDLGDASAAVRPVNFNAPPFKAPSIAKGPAMALRSAFGHVDSK